MGEGRVSVETNIKWLPRICEATFASLRIPRASAGAPPQCNRQMKRRHRQRQGVYCLKTRSLTDSSTGGRIPLAGIRRG